MPTAALHTAYRVFLVDDHPLFRLGLASLLRSDGQCEICGEAEDAQSALSSLRTTPADLVIIDIELRETNGIELLKQLKAELPHLRTLLMSMHDEELYVERALRAGATGYLRKDAPPEQVLDAVSRVLRGGLVLSAQSAETILRRMTLSGATPAASELRHLSDRELEIFQMMGQGVSTRECAERLHISIKTIEAHQASIKSKLGLKGVNQLRRHAVLWVNQLSSPAGPVASRSPRDPEKPGS
jgi:DNA-binding NarL/FixJ family response regulator